MSPTMTLLKNSQDEKWISIAVKINGPHERYTLINWLDGFIEGPSLICTNEVRFQNEQDAIIFRLSDWRVH